MKEDVNAIEEAHYTNYRGKFQSSRGKCREREGRDFFSNMTKTSTGDKHGSNPQGPDVILLTCHICNSIFHFAGSIGQGCPESYESLQAAYETSV